MVRTLLAERFELRLRRNTREVAVYELTTGRNGPKLTNVSEAGRGVGLRRAQLDGRGASMAALAAVLTNRLGRAVVDRTGLTGFYDFTLTWPSDVSADDFESLIFSAIHEQLGLKLGAARGPVEFLTIEQADRPSGN
jgi:uncharacterized protein (TIGR03435 family)